MDTLRTYKRHWERTRQEQAEHDMTKRREYVSSKTRDGKMQPRNIELPSGLGECIQRGSKADQAGKARIDNPFVAMRARAWTYGWDREHTKNGACAGCERCIAGTKDPGTSFKGWLRARRFAVGGYTWSEPC